MADELRMALLELLCKAELEQDADFLREGVRALSEALLELEVAQHLGAGEQGRVVSQAIVIAVGVRSTGEREVLGLDVGPSEDGEFWLQFLRDLVGRGL